MQRTYPHPPTYLTPSRAYSTRYNEDVQATVFFMERYNVGASSA